VIVVVLLALAGFLVGGVFTTWKNGNRILAAILGVCAVLAAVGAVLWWK
jgi:membrane protein DedA with SNARE-associated domain